MGKGDLEMSRQISRTQLIQENRIARTFLDGMIESCKNGLFQSAYEPLMDSISLRKNVTEN